MIKQIFKKTTALVLALCLLVEIFLPTTALAMNGPTQPEFSDFESVSTNNMVDPFTGDFTYNLPVLEVPGPNGGGYAVSLSYHSGITPEEDASWVGYGFTLNPGAIIRNKRGFADDVNKGRVTQYCAMPENSTLAVGATLDASLRVFGIASLKEGATKVIQFNNQKGVTTQSIPFVGYQLGLKSTTHSHIDGEERVEYSYVSPLSFAFNVVSETSGTILKCMQATAGSSPQKQTTMHRLNNISNISKIGSVASGGSVSSSRYGAYTLNNNAMPSYIPKISSISSSLSFGTYFAPAPLPIGMGASIFGTATFQFIDDKKETVDYYGYLYSDKASSDVSNQMMDYTLEKNDPYNLRDRYLSIPYSGADYFNVVGDGISGTFRAYSKTPGHFSPNKQNSSGGMGGSLTLNVTSGADVGISGGSGEVSTSSVSIEKWNDDGTNSDYDFTGKGNEPYYFKFIGDMGGYQSLSSTDEATCASLSGSDKNGYKPKLSDVYTSVNEGEDVGRSSFIAYTKNANIYSNSPYRYSNRIDIDQLVDRSKDDLIGEFAITNQNGSQFVYGLPVYAKDEQELSLGIDKDYVNGDGEGVYITHKDLTSFDGDKEIPNDDVENYQGQYIADKYASTFLLTQITSPNYIDRTNNGPSTDDFGGWTKFNYTKLYGDEKLGWYNWRTPYTGFYYNPRELSNKNDDLASFSRGKKEIYFLESIETATHIAKFILEDRADAIETATSSTVDEDKVVIGTNSLKKLTQIKLYAKDKNGKEGKLIKTVNFQYDYSLMNGIPNFNSSKDGNYNALMGTGKLTLKKVWFDYADAKNAKISPYEFNYTYAEDGTYPALYADLDNYNSYNEVEQNPEYQTYNTDAWGSYRYDGKERKNIYNNSINQTPAASFDPAAWHLKQIILPTQAQLHIQYEQDDYAYVQDRKAMLLLPLKSVDEEITSNGAGDVGAKYTLDLTGTEYEGLGSDDMEMIRLKKYIQSIFIDGQNGKDPQKMYFKFLYNLNGNTPTWTDNEDNCSNEYIEGYANVYEVGFVGNDIYVKLGDNPDDGDDNSSEGYTSPYDACQEFYKTNRGMNFSGGCSISGNLNSGSQNDDGDKIKSLLMQLIDMGSTEIKCCQKLKPDMSYLKIPIPGAKKGGGLRVKRLLTFDKGLESDGADKMLYGQEFTYQTVDGASSGVASNEPSGIRNENALVAYLKKRSESSKQQVLAAGEDMQQFEGPMGENILPSPMVGYSRVVATNIYTGHTQDGFSVYEYYTTKDFPFDGTFGADNDGDGEGDYKCADHTKINKEKFHPDPDFGVFKNEVKMNAWGSQGFSFIINNMSGQLKSTAKCAGNYKYVNVPDSVTTVSKTSYNYFDIGEKIPVMNKYGSFESLPLGKETEVVIESKHVEDKYHTASLETEAGVLYWGVLTVPYFLALPFETFDETNLSTHVTNKIIHYPAVVKSVTTYQDGVYNTVLNKYFDPNSGTPVVTEQSGKFDGLEFYGNKHNGKYTAFNFLANEYYPGMGQKANHEGKEIDISTYSLRKTTGGIDVLKDKSGSDINEFTNQFSKGDLIQISSSTHSVEFYNVEDVQSKQLLLIANENYYSSSANITDVSGVKIIRSGKANMLTASAGNIVTYGDLDEAATSNYSATEAAYRNKLADYLNDVASSSSASSVAMPEEINYISLVDEETGECSSCMQPAYILEDGLAHLTDWQDKLQNYNIDNYEAFTPDELNGWAQQNEVDIRYEFIEQYFNFLDHILIPNGNPTDIPWPEDGSFVNYINTMYQEWQTQNVASTISEYFYNKYQYK